MACYAEVSSFDQRGFAVFKGATEVAKQAEHLGQVETIGGRPILLVEYTEM